VSAAAQKRRKPFSRSIFVLDPLISRTLGRYLIQAEIGRGGMARVYRALDTVLQRPVALKVLQPSLSADPEFSRRFEREAITAANVRHPAIVTIYDVGDVDNLRYIAMEYIAGRTLMEMLQERGRLGLPLTIAILEPVAQALDYAHQQGMVHRDIKPHNIMLDMDGRVLLTDFGIAIGQDDRGERLTRTGVFMGTPEYISPEQAQSQPLTGHSDLYSLAVVAYEMLSGCVPFGGGTAQQIMAHAYQSPPPLTSVDGTQPVELNDIFQRALAKDPNQRFVSAGTLLDALRGVARRYGMAAATRDTIAELAQPLVGSAGQATVLMGTPGCNNQPAPATMPPAMVVPVPLAQSANDAAFAPRNMPMGRATPDNMPVGAVPRGGLGRAGGGDRLPPGARLPSRPADNEGGGRLPWAILAISALAIVLTVFAFVQFRNAANNAAPDPSAATILSSTALEEYKTVIVPTPTGTPEGIPNPEPPTPTPTPTNTALPVPTDTPVPPTDTPVPPTDTPVPPTDTPVPPTPTDTLVPPTDTPVPPTDTPVPPTPTPTLTPTPSATVTPGSSDTPPPPPINTDTPTITATSTPTETFTTTATLTTTQTITPTETATPSPVAFSVDADILANIHNQIDGNQEQVSDVAPITPLFPFPDATHAEHWALASAPRRATFVRSTTTTRSVIASAAR